LTQLLLPASIPEIPLGRIWQHISDKRDRPLFSEAEVSELRSGLAELLASFGCPCSLAVQDHQPSLLDAWRALSDLVHDIDSDLLGILAAGVSSGVVEPIPAVLEEPSFEPVELLVYLDPWLSGLEDVSLTHDLIEADVKAGSAYILAGGEQEARTRWGDLVASGKLAVVHVPGKNPRLIGDGSVSRANATSVRLPGLKVLILAGGSRRKLGCIVV